MHFLYILQLAQGCGDVEHGRELDHHGVSTVKQLRSQFCDIGRTVAEYHSLPSMNITPRRVYKDEVLMGQVGEDIKGISIHNIEVMEPEQREVMASQTAQVFALFNEGKMPEVPSNHGSIDTESACEVSHRFTTGKGGDERSLIRCRQL